MVKIYAKIKKGQRYETQNHQHKDVVKQAFTFLEKHEGIVFNANNQLSDDLIERLQS